VRRGRRHWPFRPLGVGFVCPAALVWQGRGSEWTQEGGGVTGAGLDWTQAAVAWRSLREATWRGSCGRWEAEAEAEAEGGSGERKGRREREGAAAVSERGMRTREQ